MTQTLLVAVVAGMVATVNPCRFAMLPAYLALVVTGASDQSRARLLIRAVVSSVMMALGFVTVFGLFGLAFSVVASSVRRYLPKPGKGAPNRARRVDVRLRRRVRDRVAVLHHWTVPRRRWIDAARR